jgi:hypothetical protein
MALPEWTVGSGHSFGEYEERTSISINLPLGNPDDVTTKVISGELPGGLTLSNNRIFGNPFEVSVFSAYEFCIRATSDEGIADRTFKMFITGPDDVEWITPEGNLRVGPVPSGQYWFDASTTKWGIKYWNGSDYIDKDVDVIIGKPTTLEEYDTDIVASFNKGVSRLYVLKNNKWYELDTDSLSVDFNEDNIVKSQFAQPANATTDYWWKLGDSDNGFLPKIRRYDAEVELFIEQDVIVSYDEPDNPADDEIWIEVFPSTTFFNVKRYDRDEGTFVLLSYEAGYSAPTSNEPATYILDNAYVDFQLEAKDSDTRTGLELEYFIADGDGELPGGLTLGKDGRLTGFVDPILALDVEAEPGYDMNIFDSYPIDWGIPDGDGFDSYLYDVQNYGFAVATKQPKKLNRNYQFFVSVNDGVNVTKRKFSIFVVGDDFVRADNTIVKAASGVYQADATYLRSPIWLTNSNLGSKRADNYVTLPLEVYDPNSLLGPISYILESVNNDGSDSELPPGLELDGSNGEIAGRIGYQPESQRNYKFTIRAERSETDDEIIEINALINRDIRAGISSIRVAKLPAGDLELLRSRNITIENRSYVVKNVEERTDYDLISLAEPLFPTFQAQSLKLYTEASPGQNYFFIDKLTEESKTFYVDRFINYSDSEEYEIQSFNPYVEWTIESGDGVALEVDYNIVGLTQVQGETFAEGVTRVVDTFLSNENISGDAYVTVSSTTKVILRLPETAATNRRLDIKKLFYKEDSSELLISKTYNFDKIILDTNLNRTLQNDSSISIGAPKGSNIVERVRTLDQEVVSVRKTFTIKLLGAVNSQITWKTDKVLPNLQANRISTLRVEAETNTNLSRLEYQIVKGKLPSGLTLQKSGEITGAIRQFGVPGIPGLTLFDSNTTTIDEGLTRFDSKYVFDVLVKDKFAEKIAIKTFELNILDPDNNLYTNITMQPFLPREQRNYFNAFINNVDIFSPQYVYRPDDPNFGVQKNLKSLVYAGIETTTINHYVGASALNHKKKNFYFGDVKTAVAKQRGSNDVVYEVVYVELVDKQDSKNGKTRTNFEAKKGLPITIDSVKLEILDDNSADIVTSSTSYVVLGKEGETIKFTGGANSVEVVLRSEDSSGVNDVIQVPSQGISFTITLQSGLSVTITESSSTIVTTSASYRHRPNGNTITTDNSAILASQNTDVQRYIANITNMRDRIKNIQVALESDSEQFRDIATDNSFLPLWMRTQQQIGSPSEEYVFALPLVYCKPGTSIFVKNNIDKFISDKNFNFNEIDYEIDRYIIEGTLNNSEEQYILFRDYKYNV